MSASFGLHVYLKYVLTFISFGHFQLIGMMMEGAQEEQVNGSSITMSRADIRITLTPQHRRRDGKIQPRLGTNLVTLRVQPQITIRIIGIKRRKVIMVIKLMMILRIVKVTVVLSRQQRMEEEKVVGVVVISGSKVMTQFLVRNTFTIP